MMNCNEKKEEIVRMEPCLGGQLGELARLDSSWINLSENIKIKSNSEVKLNIDKSQKWPQK